MLGFFSYLLRAVPAHSALFEKWNNLFSRKTFKTTCRLGGCSIPNDLNLENLEGKSHNWAHCQNFPAFFHYTARMPLFSRITPDMGYFRNGENLYVATKKCFQNFLIRTLFSITLSLYSEITQQKILRCKMILIFLAAFIR